MVDILVLGATGYSGRLIARYLLSHPERSSFTLALAVRTRAKLDPTLEAFLEAVPIFQVDITDFATLEPIVKQSKIVINAVGPYWRSGSTVVRACALNGVHYVDITGETPFIYHIIHQFDYLATKTHAIIVPSCGFDSLPSDAVVYLSNKTLKRERGPDATIASSTTAADMRGRAAGGTLATAVYFIEEVPANTRALALRDWSLSPIVGLPSPPKRMLYMLPSPTSRRTYGGTFPMAPINRAIVERTWGLHQYAYQYAHVSAARRLEAKPLTYGPAFTYEEFLPTSNALNGFAMSVVFAVSAWCMTFISPIRWLFKHLVTQPGQGPPENTLDKGYFQYTNITISAETPPTYIKTTFNGRGDPGLLLTAQMLSESALAILLQKDELPALAAQGGVLTPMSALGDVVLARLEKTGRFEFHSEVLDAEEESRKTR